MKKIYVIYGQTGEYSDHTDWLVCAYEDKKKAEEHANKATDAAYEIYKKEGRYGKKEPTPKALAYDPGMTISSTGTDYMVIEVELRTKVPKEGEG